MEESTASMLPTSSRTHSLPRAAITTSLQSHNVAANRTVVASVPSLVRNGGDVMVPPASNAYASSASNIIAHSSTTTMSSSSSTSSSSSPSSFSSSSSSPSSAPNASFSSSSSSSFFSSTSSSRPPPPAPRRPPMLGQAFAAWSAVAPPLLDPSHLPPLLPVPGTSVFTGESSPSHIYSSAEPHGNESPSPSAATIAAVSSAFFGGPPSSFSSSSEALAAANGMVGLTSSAYAGGGSANITPLSTTTTTAGGGGGSGGGGASSVGVGSSPVYKTDSEKDIFSQGSPSFFASSISSVAGHSPSLSVTTSGGGGGRPWYPLRAPPVSAAAAAVAATKRRCVHFPPSSIPPSMPFSGPSGATATTYSPDGAADCVEITALGAGSEVGRSCVLLQHRGYCVMFDCGVHPAHSGIGALPIFDAFDMRKVSVCLITHFHLDHCGALPYLLCKTSFRGRVFMTAPTKVISRLLWLDYARMAAFDEDTRSSAAAGGSSSSISGGRGGGGLTGGSGAPTATGGGGGRSSAAIYSEQDVDEALRMIEIIDFHQEVEVQGIKISCYGAGHVLGACMFLVETGGVRTLYTGDFSSEEDRHVPAAELPAVDVQLLLCESTYGVQVHEPRLQRENRLIAAILEIVIQRRGKVLLPVFALGRVQELLLILEEYWRSHPAVQHVPILFISPLASKSIAVFDAFLHMSGHQLRQQALQGENPFAFHFVKSLKSYDGAAARLYVHRDAPAVIFAAPGMLQSGASRRIFEALAPHARNGVILTGYSVKGTLAEELKREPEHLVLQRSEGGPGGSGAAGGGGASTGESGAELQPQQHILRRRCSCQVISFSAHSDYLQTSAFIKQLRVPNVVLVHGERNEMRRLRDKLQEESPDLAVFTPEILQTVSLQFCSSNSSNSNSSHSSSSSSGGIPSSTSTATPSVNNTSAPVCAVVAGKLAHEIVRTCEGRSSSISRRDDDDDANGNDEERTQKKPSKNFKSNKSARKSNITTESVEEEDEEDEEENDGDADNADEKEVKDDDLLLDVEGVVVIEEGEHPLVVHAEDLSATARIPVMRMQQKLRLAFPYPLCLLRKAAALIFEDCVSFDLSADPHPPHHHYRHHQSSTAAGRLTEKSVGQKSALPADRLQNGRSRLNTGEMSSLCNGDGNTTTTNGGRGGGVGNALGKSVDRRCSSTTNSSSGISSKTDDDDDDDEASDAGFCVGDCVSVYRHPKCTEEVVIEWLTGPTADMVADALSFLALDILRVNDPHSTSGGCYKAAQSLLCDREEQSDAVLVDVLQAELSHVFGAVHVISRRAHRAAAAANTAALQAAEQKMVAAADAGKARERGGRGGGERGRGATAEDSNRTSLVKWRPAEPVKENSDPQAEPEADNKTAGYGSAVSTAESENVQRMNGIVDGMVQDKQTEDAQRHEEENEEAKTQKQEEEEEEEEKRIDAPVERAELEVGEVVLRFWARRQIAAASTSGGVSSAEDSSTTGADQDRQDGDRAHATTPTTTTPAGQKHASFVLVPVEIDISQRTVHCEDAEVRQRVQNFVRRVETSLLPLPLFS